MPAPKLLRDKAFRLRCRAIDARTDAKAAPRIGVAQALEAAADARRAGRIVEE